MADLIGKVESNELLVEVDIIGTGPRGLPGPKGDPGDVTAESIREALGYTPADDATAMEYKILGFNGSAFLDESGNTLDFSTLHELCLDKKNFVYVSYSNRLYIPQYINTNNVWFEAAYIDNEVPYMHRLGINSRNAVNVYTKALAVKSDMDAAKESIATLEGTVEELNENKANKSEIPDVPVTDVQVNGESIVKNKIANILTATLSTLFLAYTDIQARVTDITKTVSKVQKTVFVTNGLIMGGTAAEAGLVTRGICGVSTPGTDGGCSKDTLYINYDGDNTFRTYRQLVLQAGSAGTHYGNNLFQYGVPRGEIVKNWVESHLETWEFEDENGVVVTKQVYSG